MRPRDFITLALVFIALIAALDELVQTHYLLAALLAANAYLLARYDHPDPEDPTP